jgi:biopolymer transport protein TolQ
VLLLLALLSLMSWAVILERVFFLKRRQAAAEAFAHVSERAVDFAALLKLCVAHGTAPAAQSLVAANQRMQRLGSDDHTDWESTLRGQAAERSREETSWLSFLATVSSASPFIGLLGTVWGVMVAFFRIGSGTGQAMLEIVGPGIAEALIATVVGLATAIPATIAYNLLLARCRRMAASHDSLLDQALLLRRNRPGSPA